MRFGMVPPPVRVWPAVAPLLMPLLKAAGESPVALLDEVDAGTAQLWIGHEGDEVRVAIVTRIRGETLVGDYCAATESPDWALVQSTIETAARNEGCKRIQIDGRKGWERIFKGYRPVRVTLEKEL